MQEREAGPRNAQHAEVEERGAQACDALTDLANELQRTEHWSGSVELDARNECRELECCGGMERYAGMVWRTGGWSRPAQRSGPRGAWLAASLMPLSQPPDFIYFQLVGRAPAPAAGMCRPVQGRSQRQAPGKLPHPVTHALPWAGSGSTFSSAQEPTQTFGTATTALPS